MNPKETKRFEKLYQRHLTLLKLQGKLKARGMLIHALFAVHEIILVVVRIK